MATAVTKRVFPATAAVPLVYRLILTTIEPLFALRGAWLVFQAPSEYLSTMTRDTVVHAAPTTFLYTSIGGGWLYFAFVSAIVLRVFDDVRLWRYLCIGMVLSDLAFCHATAQAVGGWVAWSKVSEWTVDDHAIFWANAPVLLVRILLILGVGVKKNPGSLKTHSDPASTGVASEPSPSTTSGGIRPTGDGSESFVTLIEPWTGIVGTISKPTTITKIPDFGTAPGTIVFATPAVFVTTISQGAAGTTTVPPSGTSPGTVDVGA